MFKGHKSYTVTVDETIDGALTVHHVPVTAEDWEHAAAWAAYVISEHHRPPFDSYSTRAVQAVSVNPEGI